MIAPDRPPPIAPLVDPAELRGWVLYSDEHLLVLDKPGWLVVHPSKNGPWSSLAGAVREEFKMDKVRWIYRLDRETSGAIILARDEGTAGRLQKAIARRRISKFYATIVEGALEHAIPVDLALGPDPSAGVTVKQRVVAADSAGAQAARTVFHPLAVAGGYSLVGVELLTGRKHQIRAHAEAIGHRVVGDKLYGPDPRLYLEFATSGWTERHAALLPLPRQALHCAAIDLRPAGMSHVFRAPWPKDLAWFTQERMGMAAAQAQTLIDDFVERMLARMETPSPDLQAPENDRPPNVP